MNISQLSGVVLRGIKGNSPLILSVSAGVGTVVTALLVAKATWKASDAIHEDIIKEREEHPGETRIRTHKDDLRVAWKFYVPPAISAAGTLMCIAGANRLGVKKAVAAQAALAVTERAYSQYRDKVVQELGAHRDTGIRDKVVADRIAANPPPPQSVLPMGPGDILCCELFTQRYFVSDMEKLRRAVNDLNAALLREAYLTFDDFYDLVGLRPTTVSNRLGWRPDRLLALEFSTTLAEDGRPCITFDYNYYETL
jgi:Family of unknown function (DUF6353)